MVYTPNAATAAAIIIDRDDHGQRISVACPVDGLDHILRAGVGGA
jgi:hypothetical protein